MWAVIFRKYFRNGELQNKKKRKEVVKANYVRKRGDWLKVEYYLYAAPHVFGSCIVIDIAKTKNSMKGRQRKRKPMKDGCVYS